MMITEHVRSRLSRQICEQNINVHGHVPLITLSPKWEQAFAESLIGERGEERQLAMAPSILQDFIVVVRTTFDKFAQSMKARFIDIPLIRPYVRSVIERSRPQTWLCRKTRSCQSQDQDGRTSLSSLPLSTPIYKIPKILTFCPYIRYDDPK